MERSGPTVPRSLAVWLAVTIGGLGVWSLALPPVLEAASAVASGAGPVVPFTGWLRGLAGGAGTVSAAWLWLNACLVVADSLRGPRLSVSASRPVRRLLYAACGVALVPLAAPPAHADPHLVAPHPAPVNGPALARLAGLPLPERAESGPSRHASPGPRTSAWSPEIIVGPGDTLWGLAARTLPEHAPAAAITRRWHALYRSNRAVIGADPDLIRPGQHLHLPRP